MSKLEFFSQEAFLFPNPIWRVKIENVDNKERFGKINIGITDEPLLDVIMNPGDMVWIPEHYPHHAISITPRLSVSFPIQIHHENGDMEDRHWFKFKG